LAVSAGDPPTGTSGNGPPSSTVGGDGAVAGTVGGNQALPPPADVLGGRAGDVLVTHVTYGGLSLSTATPLDRIRQTLGTTRHLLWILGPILVALVAGLAWLLVGRALRPVHAVTSQVAAIGSRSLNERVPVPAAGDEITELAETMNSMLERLESANDTSRRLVSDAAHELRTPVAVMRTELEVTRSAPEPDWQATGDVLLDELGRLSGLVDDLLLLARGDERAAARDHVVLADVVHDVAARRRRIPVEVLIADPDLDVVGDDEALRRAVDHLVANAARHGAGTVRITVEADPGGQLAIHVDDDGPGIAAADRDAVVRRFVRLDEGRSRDGGGAGLGLAVVTDVAAAHGGRLEIGDAPQPLSGARLTIHLPRRPPLASAAATTH
jgi:signal transduction histidine kinase